MYYADIDKDGFLLGWYSDEVHVKEDIPKLAMQVSDDVWLDAVSANANFYDKNSNTFMIRDKPKTKEQEVEDAIERKSYLLLEANEAIAPLQDAVDLNMATDTEIGLLAAWKEHRVLVNRTDTSLAPNIEWSQAPTSKN
ncbi:tail fiber assembly protein [Providencia hangzhouensis]|uniref:tail fiber assembly protein n=1 Tax=Providencia hangzhouensis TaxID=3031799 RepID=UPI0034DD5D4B